MQCSGVTGWSGGRRATCQRNLQHGLVWTDPAHRAIGVMHGDIAIDSDKQLRSLWRRLPPIAG
jgi:hypothetical protein